MIYVFYSNDPLSNDQGGGAEHFRGIYRALCKSGVEFRLIASRMSMHHRVDPRVEYISSGANFLKYYAALWLWFLRNRRSFTPDDIFHFHRNYAAWPKLLIGSHASGKTIVTYHNTTGLVLKSRFGQFATPLRWFMKIAERRVAALVDQIIFVSDRDRQQLCAEILRENFAKTCVIPASFDSDRFSNSAPPPRDLRHRLLTIGRLSDQKNIPLAIATAQELRRRGFHVTLTVAGDGERRTEIEALVRQSNCQAFVTLLGKVEHDKVPALMQSHGIVLVTSDFEASPTVVKEAIASKRPVVTTDVGDVNVWVKQGRNGFVCEGSASGLADGVQAAIDLVSTGLYERAVDLGKFSEEAIMTMVLNCYRSPGTTAA